MRCYLANPHHRLLTVSLLLIAPIFDNLFVAVLPVPSAFALQPDHQPSEQNQSDSCTIAVLRRTIADAFYPIGLFSGRS